MVNDAAAITAPPSSAPPKGSRYDSTMTKRERKAARAAELKAKRSVERAAMSLSVPTVMPLKPGPPRKYSEELANRILDAMLHHGSLKKACDLEPGLPDRVTVQRWVIAQPEFAAAYYRVRAAAVEAWVDDMVDIVDRDDIDPLDKRVRIDARRWIMSKIAPQRYGDKVIIGGDGSFGGLGGAAVSLSDLSDDQLAALEALAALRLPDDEVEAV
jgi:hypothetical protein